jgi:DNA-binding NtrC family response regulator
MPSDKLHKILIVDDDVAVTNYLMVFFMQTEKFEPTIMNDSSDVPMLLERENFDALILDMDMPQLSGSDILRFVKENSIKTPVIVLTGVADVELAVDSMKLGAFDYLTKPVEDEHLLDVLTKAIEHSEMHTTIDQLPTDLSCDNLEHKQAFEHVPTRDPVMIRILHQAEKIAVGDLSIFLWGEIGTGKRTLAEAIHRISPRFKNPFIPVNAAAEDPDKFPALFFGQAKDWSGARADRPGLIEEVEGGTLFLDEIDSLTIPMQHRLWRVIQQGESYREGSTRIQKVNVRFIVSSNHDLTKDEYRKSFSRDLLYHLMINSIRIPPLREWRDDIPLIAIVFLKEENEKAGRNIKGISDDFMALLMKHNFPGNLRELRHIIATMVVNEESSSIRVESMPLYINDLLRGKTQPIEIDFKPRKLSDVRREHVQKTLRFFSDDKIKAAESLGIDVTELDALGK